MSQRVLFDQGVPVPLKSYLEAFDIDTVFERGWSTLENGALIDKAEIDNYELFVTTDKNLKYQQNLQERRIAIIVLPTPSWPVLRQHTAHIENQLLSADVNSFIEIVLPKGT